MKIWVVVVVVVCVVSNMMESCCVKALAQRVPCFFIFGDSLADSGNNNHLHTSAKVNYPPYGIDFPEGQLLGFEHFIQPFATAAGTDNILDGVNYASGSAGILRQTGQHLGENVNFLGQVWNHRVVMAQMGKILGNRELTRQHLSKCFYWVGLGSNDYINNYYSPSHYTSSRIYTPEQFASVLIEEYCRQILTLYRYGARKVALAGIGRVGCTPNSLFLHDTKGSACVDYINKAVGYFNDKLLGLVEKLNSNFSDAKFIYIDSYGLGGVDPTSFGFKNWSSGCCAVNDVGQCIPSKNPCENRKEYVFWDSFHPTEALNLITANRIFSAENLSDTYPMDVNQLVQISSA
ncbi:hypothetical protein TIFTF001_012638 [Ficus carica]|uniref:GDSL esterase/lipase n=1 Tax=Ficus carica TaxID=3494 RepID=A0AA88D3W3_FICCA|nr:hypothetical protein TIFTF001_012638 [Ficus carica]